MSARAVLDRLSSGKKTQRDFICLIGYQIAYPVSGVTVAVLSEFALLWLGGAIPKANAVQLVD